MATDSAPDVGGADDALVSARQTDSTLDTLADYCYPLYRRFVQRRRTFVSTVDEKLDEALRDTTVELFLSRAIAIGLVVVASLSSERMATIGAMGTVAFAGILMITGIWEIPVVLWFAALIIAVGGHALTKAQRGGVVG
jgi:hypothetical protein